MSSLGQRLLATLFIAVFLAPPVMGREAVVTTHDGRQIKGQFVMEDDFDIVLSISSIRTSIPRSQVKQVQYLETALEQYRKRRADLDDSDVEGRFRLALELYQQHEFALVMRELADLGESVSENARIGALRRLTAQRLEAHGPVLALAVQEDREAKPKPKPSEKGKGKRRHLLTKEQINLLKIYEIDLEGEPNVNVPRATVDKLLEQYAEFDEIPKGVSAQNQFRRLPGWRKLQAMFQVQARPLYPEVTARQNPPAMMVFRSQVHQKYVVGFCGSLRCHGRSGGAGNLQILNDLRNKWEFVYTNFYILQLFDNDVGRMIDRDQPEQSLLVQYGLAPQAAIKRHPEVQGWRREFRSDEDRRFRKIVDWIGQLWKPAPQYGIDYVPPGTEQEKPADDSTEDEEGGNSPDSDEEA